MPHAFRQPATLLNGLCLVLALMGYGSAQTLSADQVLANLQTSGETLEDASFTLTGSITESSADTPLELNVQLIPEQKLIRADILQPAALADNFIVVDDQAFYNYLFVTNQVTVLDTNDPDALAGLFPDAQAQVEEAGEEFNFDLSLDSLSEGWDVALEGYGESPVGNAYTLRFTNQDDTATVRYVNAEIADGEGNGNWYPYTLTFLNADSTTLASLTFENFKRDTGLNPADLRFIPRRRRNYRRKVNKQKVTPLVSLVKRAPRPSFPAPRYGRTLRG